jgi:hypothetical protein
MVVTAIITIMTSVLLFQQRKFDSTTILRSLGYSVALSIRQAQIYGGAVKQFDISSNAFNYNYGIYTSTALACPSGAWNTCYQLVADLNTNDVTNTALYQAVQTFKISKGYSINKFCVVRTSDNFYLCSPTISFLNIYFKRPNPEANIVTDRSSLGETYSSASIQVIGPDGVSTRSATTTVTGQITVGGAGT